MEKKHILIALAAILLVIGSAFAVCIVRERNSDPLLEANTEALNRFELPYKNAENYLYEDGHLCCKDAYDRWCTIGYFCN